MWMVKVAIIMAGLVWSVGCTREAMNSVTCEDARELESRPQDFVGKDVCVTGVVSERVDWPLTEHDYFKVSQGAGGVWVHGDSPPPKGTRITVRGVYVRGKRCYSPLLDHVICQSGREIH